MVEVRYPEVVVDFNIDGNAFNIIGTVQRALRKHGVSQEELDEFYAECTSGDYDNLLQTCVRWVTPTFKEDDY